MVREIGQGSAILAPELSATPQKARGSMHCNWRESAWKLLSAWELYPVLLVAALLRFYGLGWTEFDTDQAVLWDMARMAVTHGWIPANSNLASIGTVNPPAFQYVLLPVAFFTANPLAGAALIALLNLIGVVLTYTFTRRNYGRLAGFVAAALTATAMLMLQYSRFIWQPNILLPLLVLYVMALFRGAVARRGGWFAPALVLLGLAVQLSGSSIYLAPALVVAMVLGYKAIRWRDLALGIILCGVIFSTYFVWEAATGYADLPLLLGASGKHAVIDGTALWDYLRFVVMYAARPTDPHLLATKIFPLLHLHEWAMYGLLFVGFVVLASGLGWERVQLMAREAEGAVVSSPLASAPRGFRARWNAFTASAQRRGILILLTWQIVPLVLLSRHAILLQVHYFLVLMPGPFIVIALLTTQCSRWIEGLRNGQPILRVVVPTLAVLLLAVQALGGVAWLLDTTDGAQTRPASYNTLHDLQNALQEADALAQARHLVHIYIDADVNTNDAFIDLAQQVRTPYTIIEKNAAHCLVLPDRTLGAAVMLFGPADGFDETLLSRLTTLTLVSQPPRLGGAPFHLSILQPLSASVRASTTSGGLVSEQSKAIRQALRGVDVPDKPSERFLATLWHESATRSASAGSSWTYHFDAAMPTNGALTKHTTADCSLTALTPNEHLFVPFTLPAETGVLTATLSIQGTLTLSTPYILNYGPLHFQTLRKRSSSMGSFGGTART